MATFKTPGVYVQEISKLPASVAQVATAVPAFMGYTKNTVANPTKVKSMLEFESLFGGPNTDVTVTVNGTNDYQSIAVAAFTYKLYYSMQLYFQNGGGPCYVISTGTFTDTPAELHFTTALGKLKKEDEPTIIVATDAVSISVAANYYNVLKACLAQCNTLQDRFTVMDLHGTDTPSTFRGGVGTQYLKYGAAYYPNLNTTYTYPDAAIKISGGVLNNKTLAEALVEAALEVAPTTPKSDALAKFIKPLRDALALQSNIVLPPSAAIAGIYCSVDADRGVWKAPANISLNGVTGPTVKITDDEQADLNVSDTGKSINAIRTFAGKGVLVWGARTLDGNSNEWRYVNVRRLFITAEESIKKATEFVVFEPNDANTWNRTKAMIENYLTGLWKDGALAGAKADEAFFVNVGLGTTMTVDDILNGKLIIEVGMAAVRPAEFIILNFSHKLQTS